MRVVLIIIGVPALSCAGVKTESRELERGRRLRRPATLYSGVIAVAAGGNFQLTYPYGDTVSILKLPKAAADRTR
jgi:hypothetical protein